MNIVKGLIHAAVVLLVYAGLLWISGNEPSFAGAAFTIALAAIIEAYADHGRR